MNAYNRLHDDIAIPAPSNFAATSNGMLAAAVNNAADAARVGAASVQGGRAVMNHHDGYRLLAGKCQPICEAIMAADPGVWRIARGFYNDPMWGQRGHWWLVSLHGDVIYDPTSRQFPCGGLLDCYEEVTEDSEVACAECGKDVKVKDASIDGNYAFCSYQCHGRFVGVL